MSKSRNGCAGNNFLLEKLVEHSQIISSLLTEVKNLAANIEALSSWINGPQGVMARLATIEAHLEKERKEEERKANLEARKLLRGIYNTSSKSYFQNVTQNKIAKIALWLSLLGMLIGTLLALGVIVI
jgi:hypothetical protein